MDRRQFIGTSAALSAGGWVSGCGGSQEAVPGRASLVPPLSRVGVQLYTVRSLMTEDVAATLDAVSAIGYDEVEFAGYFGHSPEQLRTWLDASGLTAPAAHVEPANLAEGLGRALEGAQTLGYKWLIQAFIPAEERTPDGYRAAAESLNRAGERAAEAGVRVGYHNHAFEFESLEGTTGFELLMSQLDPAYVDFEIDLHWAAAGGADIPGLFESGPGRFRLCHVKGLGEGGEMVDVGDGIIDWAGLFAQSELAGLDHYLVEHDQPEDPLASIEASYRYLTGA